MQGLKRLTIPAMLASVMFFSVPLATASEYEAEIDYRQGVMDILSYNAKQIGAMLKGNKPYDAEKIKTHAADIASVASLDILAGFPEDSTSADSSALEDIWLDFGTFKEKLNDFEVAAANLNKAAAGGDRGAIGQAMGALGDSCKGCHRPFKN